MDGSVEISVSKAQLYKVPQIVQFRNSPLSIISQNELSLDIFRQTILWIEAAVPRYSVELLKTSPNS